MKATCMQHQKLQAQSFRAICHHFKDWE